MISPLLRWMRQPSSTPRSGPEIVFRPQPVGSVAPTPERPPEDISGAREVVREYLDGRLIPRHHSEIPRFNGLIECPHCFEPWGEDDGMCMHPSERQRAKFWEVDWGVDMEGFEPKS